MIKCLLVFLILIVGSAPAHYRLYIWKCVNCDCYFYGKNPPKNSKCLRQGLDIWKLEKIEDVPLRKQLSERLG